MSRLETAALMLRDLPEVQAEWDRLEEGERVGWSLDWSNEMSGLERLSHDLNAGLLSDAQHDRFAEIENMLAEVRPVLKHLDLYEPKFLPD